MRYLVTRTVEAGAMGVYRAGQVVEMTDQHAGWLTVTYGPDVLADPPADEPEDNPSEGPVAEVGKPRRTRRTGDG